MAVLKSQLNAEQTRIAELEALVKQLTAARPKLTLKVSEKGAVSAYGLGRWPVTLYKGQWERVLDAKDEIVAFMVTNNAKLTTK